MKETGEKRDASVPGGFSAAAVQKTDYSYFSDL